MRLVSGQERWFALEPKTNLNFIYIRFVYIDLLERQSITLVF